MSNSIHGRRIRTSLAFLVFACATFADPLGVYSVIPCNGPAQVVCSVTPGGHAPTTRDVAGLSNSLFTDYFEALVQDLESYPDPTFGWTALAASADGTVVGSVWGTDEIHTEFVYRSGQILCCTADDPFTILGINDDDLTVGIGPAGGGFAAFASASTGLSGGPSFVDPAFDPYLFPYQFIAVDNQNRILAVGPGQEYMLTPLDPAPEPNSLVLFLTLVAGGLALAGRISPLSISSRKRPEC